MWRRIDLPWANPIAYAAAVPSSEPCWVLLHSAQRYDYTGRYSLLGVKRRDEVKAGAFAPLEEKLSLDRPAFENAWFGFLAYELRHDVERLPADMPGKLALPRLWFVQFHVLLVFDHEVQRVTAWLSPEADTAWIPSPVIELSEAPPPPAIIALDSAMTRQAYLEKAAHLLNYIRAGDVYQANLTRKCSGMLETPSAFGLYRRLLAASPASYGAYLKLEDTFILSSSPERFLIVDAGGHAESRPIKGTAPRSSDPAVDHALAEGLRHSEKDRAENLMIVDLMRHDLSRSCTAGSVTVSGLFDVTSYPTLHHMASTVSGRKHPDISTLELVKRCFPPGSMTGAPKIRAMEICTELENLERGIYSGALGWFGGDGGCDLSVVIRTLILTRTGGPSRYDFEFQTGGAIVADSTPEGEWQEMLTKAQGICTALGIDVAD